MLKSVTLVVSIIFSLTSFNQNEGQKLSGRVIESSGVAIPYASILAYSFPDSALITGSSTDTSGYFFLNLNAGNYFLKVRFLSYNERIISTIKIENQPVNIGDIVLEVKESYLDAVDVVVEKSLMELKLDKRVFNIQKDMSNIGMNVSDILDNIPSISVDAEGNVSLRGSQNVRILINGKPTSLTGMSNADALRQINGDMIESVEVITNPSARYDAEGEVGIINIILKKELEKGFNGSINARAGWPLNYGAGFSLNFRQKKVNYFAGYGYGYQESPGFGYNDQRFNGPDTSYRYTQNSTHVRGGFSHNFNGGFDWQLTKHLSVNLSSRFNFSAGDNWNSIEYQDYDLNNDLSQIVNRDEFEDEHGNSQDYNFSLRKTFDQKERLLTFDFKKGFSVDGEISDLIQTSDDALVPDMVQRTTSFEDEDSWLFQLDYIHPLGKEGKFETGAKASLRNLSNDYKLEDSLAGGWEINPLFDNFLIYTENIYAAYLMAGNKTKKFSYQGGLRAEYSDITTKLVQTNEVNPRQYLQLFPSFHFAYELKKNNFIQLSYSRRISRPRHWWLTPFYTFRDSRNYESGNPNLNPEFTGAYELGHLKYWKKGSILSSLYYRHTTDIMQRILFTDSTGITWRIPVNVGEENSFGIEFSGSYEIFKWWSFNGSFNFYRAISYGEYLGTVYENDAYRWSNRITSKFNIKRKLSLQTSFSYESPTSTNQGSDKAQYHWDAAGSVDILKGNGTLSINARDILNTRKRRSIVETPTFYSESEFQWRSRQITLNFTYRINQKKGKPERNNFGEEGGGE